MYIFLIASFSVIKFDCLFYFLCRITVKETLIISESGEMIDTKNEKEKVRTYVLFGDEKIPFKQEEVVVIKNQSFGIPGAPCLLLLGFKPMSSIPLTRQMDRAYFAYPNDEVAPGSKVAFAALHTAMCHKRVIGIGELSTSRRGIPRLVSIVPQPEKRAQLSDDPHDLLTVQLEPPGFVLLPLPYKDDARAVAETACTTASDEAVESAKQLIRAQPIDGIEWGTDFANPALTKFWDYVEAIGLSHPVPEFIDETEMNEDVIKECAGEQIEVFQRSLPEEENGKKTTEGKRQAKISSDLDRTLDFAAMAKAGTLDTCTKDVLQGFLRSVGITVGGNKPALIERITEYIECPESVEKKMKRSKKK